MHVIASAIVVIVLLGCRPTAADAPAVAQIAARAAQQLAPGGRPESWDVSLVADSVPDAAIVAESLRVRLRVRPRAETDSLRHKLTLLAAHWTGTALELHLEVATIQRCGPTWKATFGYSGNYIVRATRSWHGWRIDSARPLIYGDPGVCSSEIAQPLT